MEKRLQSHLFRQRSRYFFNETYGYVREIVGADHAALEFKVTVHEQEVNGIDIITWNAQELIIEVKVMLRPLKVINFIHQNMDEILKDRK